MNTSEPMAWCADDYNVVPVVVVSVTLPDPSGWHEATAGEVAAYESYWDAWHAAHHAGADMDQWAVEYRQRSRDAVQ